jgi:hypothetical protein
MQPHGITDTRPTPENGRDGWSFPIGICSILKVARLMRLRAAPPSIKTWYSLTLEMLRETNSGSRLAPAMLLGAVRGVEPNRSFHPLTVWCGFRCRGHRRNLSTQSFDDTPGRDGPGTSEHDMECLPVLIVAGLRVGVAIGCTQCLFGILELHLCVFLLLCVHLLLALPLAGRRAILALLLHLFTELFRELLDLPAL